MADELDTSAAAATASSSHTTSSYNLDQHGQLAPTQGSIISTVRPLDCTLSASSASPANAAQAGDRSVAPTASGAAGSPSITAANTLDPQSQSGSISARRDESDAGIALLAHNECPSMVVDMNGIWSDEVDDEKHGQGHDEPRGGGLFTGSEKEEMKRHKKISKERAGDDPNLAHFTPDQRRIILEQIEMGYGTRKARYIDLYRFSNKFELFLDLVGLIAAVTAGVVQPLMTLLFGNLTTLFTDYGTKLASGQDTTAESVRLFDEVNRDALYLVYIGFGTFATTYIYMATWIWTGEFTTRRIREGYLRSVLRQNVGFFDTIGPGEVTTRITSEIHLIQEGISDKVPIAVQLMSQFVAGFVVAFSVNWRMTLVLSAMVPAVGLNGAIMYGYQARYGSRILNLVAEGAALAEEAISLVRTSHAFGTQKKLADLYDVPNLKAQQYGKKISILTAITMALFAFIMHAAYALAFFYGARLLASGRATPGDIITCFFAILTGAFSLPQASPRLQAMGYATGAARKVLATIWRIPPIDSSCDDGLRLEKVEGTITFEGVDFYYPSRPSVKVLDKFSATFPSGKVMALVGASGSGKSSVIGLIERFYNTLDGAIKLDGHDISKMNVRWLRSQIGLVSQEPTLFAATIWENVAYGLINTPHENKSEEVKRKMVQSACELANAHAFIGNLPEGYETNIGERGMLLSGGQKQRIAIARAIVSDPPILLLDEATSALDTHSERLVQKALDKAATGRTTITIAHRLSTIKDANQIIVMSKGVIVETGTHDQLLSDPTGAYASLVWAQKLKEEGDAADSDSDKAKDEAPVGQDEVGEVWNAATTKLSGAGVPETDDIAGHKELEKEDDKLAVHGVLYLLIRLVKEIPESRWYYFIGILCSIGLGMVYPIFAIVFGSILGVFSSTDNDYVRDRSNYYSGLLFAIACTAFLAIACQSYCFDWTSEYMSRVLRLRIFGTILRQDIAFFDEDKHSTGALTSSISDQPQKVHAVMGLTLGTSIQSLGTLVGGVIVGLCYAWKLSLVGIACIPLMLGSGMIGLRVVQLKDEKTRRFHDKAAQTACEAAGAIRTVASLTREADAVAVYSRALDAPMRISKRIALVSNVFSSIAQALCFPVFALMFWYGSHQIVEDGLSTRDFFISYAAVIYGTINAGFIFTYVPDMASAKGAAGRIVRLLDRKVDIDSENPDGNPLVIAQGQVTFKNVHFRYPTRPSVPVLRGLNLTVKPGEFVALVGPSGCGKSTIIQLIERFYDPISGSVDIDGQNIRNLNVKSLRESVSLVAQEPTLYDGSVRFNITLGAITEPTQEEIVEVCKKANIYDFIESLPEGFDTRVGGKGSQLSGGQKQRIAIARALIRNPKILLLDEATSALDSQSEKVVQVALDAAAKDRTTIAVAHRLSTIQNADRIFVLKDGIVAEEGTHSQLIQEGGVYAELVQQQALERAA